MVELTLSADIGHPGATSFFVEHHLVWHFTAFTCKERQSTSVFLAYQLRVFVTRRWRFIGEGWASLLSQI